jgi:hypothetical protein
MASKPSSSAKKKGHINLALKQQQLRIITSRIAAGLGGIGK